MQSPTGSVAHEQAYLAAVAQCDQAKANLALLKAGAWEADKDIAYAQVEQARAQVEQDRDAPWTCCQVRAPVDGTILQVNVRPGEYVAAAAGPGPDRDGQPHPLHVRVNIDEEDLPRLKLSARPGPRSAATRAQEELPPALRSAGALCRAQDLARPGPTRSASIPGSSR